MAYQKHQNNKFYKSHDYGQKTHLGLYGQLVSKDPAIQLNGLKIFEDSSRHMGCRTRDALKPHVMGAINSLLAKKEGNYSQEARDILGKLPKDWRNAFLESNEIFKAEQLLLAEEAKAKNNA